MAGIGVLPPRPMLGAIYSSPWAAAMVALTSGEDGSVSLRLDEFVDGVAALTLGESARTRGALRKIFEQAERLDDMQPLKNLYVNVLSRRAFSRDRRMSPVLGHYASNASIAIRERVALCAGDVRALSRVLLREERPFLNGTTDTWSGPFSGPFSRGGDLQFDRESGLTLSRRRFPRESDRKAALAWAKDLTTQLERLPSERWSWAGGEALAHEWRKSLTEASPAWPAFTDSERRGAEALDRVLGFIEKNCCRQVRVAELAQIAGVRESRFHELFRRLIGCSPAQYALERRLDLAERLLRQTELSVSEVSERCGFAEQSGLAHALKRQRGVTPTALRKMLNPPLPPSPPS